MNWLERPFEEEETRRATWDLGSEKMPNTDGYDRVLQEMLRHGKNKFI